MQKLKKWRRSGILTNTRTTGQVSINCNGDFVDIWLRVNGREVWVAVLRKDILSAINNNGNFIVISADSDGNSE